MRLQPGKRNAAHQHEQADHCDAKFEKTAQRAGKTIGQFVNEDVRAFFQGQLTQSQLPASPRDLQVQVEQLTQMVEGIAARLNEPARKSLWQRVFGK